MANGTIREPFLRQTLAGGFNSYPAVLVAKNASNFGVSSQSLTFNDASNGSTTIPQTILNIEEGVTVTKLELQTTGGTILWDINETFEFTQEGTLTVDLTFNLNQGTIPVISGTNVSFPVGARTFILGNGLGGRTIRGVFQEIISVSEINTFIDTGTMGNSASISSSSTEASINLVADSISVNIPSNTDIHDIGVFDDSTEAKLFSLFNDNPNLYSFTEAGTLTFSDITFSVSV